MLLYTRVAPPKAPKKRSRAGRHYRPGKIFASRRLLLTVESSSECRMRVLVSLAEVPLP